MAPHAFDHPIGKDPENLTNFPNFGNIPEKNDYKSDNYKLQIFHSTLNSLANILTGVILAVVYWFAFRNGTPLGATPLHILLCVTGYHLLMAQAILSLATSNGWSSKLKWADKRRSHWILQIIGSGLAISGSFVKILDKTAHWNTLHGQFALVALVFTSISLVNGLSSLYIYELRGIISGNLIKLTHVCFGTIAFCSATICFCYGLEKGLFRSWATDPLAYTLITFVAILTFIVIMSPVLNFYNKSKSFLKR